MCISKAVFNGDFRISWILAEFWGLGWVQWCSAARHCQQLCCISHELFHGYTLQMLIDQNRRLSSGFICRFGSLKATQLGIDTVCKILRDMYAAAKVPWPLLWLWLWLHAGIVECWGCFLEGPEQISGFLICESLRSISLWGTKIPTVWAFPLRRLLSGYTTWLITWKLLALAVESHKKARLAVLRPTRGLWFRGRRCCIDIYWIVLMLWLKKNRSFCLMWV